eukprot:CAMPEP_0184855284 /NCGR_PEP_ID=MMETSP0580-20130426/577_1 /TAXON_ID=1118495 /ORGANISM="Dactyliosolen fragilissimus" /LENGTH=494 /DNA_ID=CAMNT_0027349759 /DNA_START=339 /DNA_END=1820 /DNA_ORIENTATION=+
MVMLLLVEPTICANFQGLEKIKSSNATSWEPNEATVELMNDVETFVLQYDPSMKESYDQKIANYIQSKMKNIRYIANHATFLATMLDFELVAYLPLQIQIQMYNSMVEIAENLNSAFVSDFSFVENRVMRGWPFKIKTNVPEFDAYQGGHVMEALALAAEQIARKGNHEIAAKFALNVAAALHDGFLTEDLERTKLDSNGVVVYVPSSASTGRLEKYKEIHSSWVKLGICFDTAQATNHGIMAGAGAIALLRAIETINWKKAKWRLLDENGTPLRRIAFRKMLKQLVESQVKFLKDSFYMKRTKTDDSYPGKNNRLYYVWDYRNVTHCPALQNTHFHRREDISHIAYELNFLTRLRAFHSSFYTIGRKSIGILKEKHMHRIIRAILAKLIYDRNEVGGKRFACDLAGIVDPMTKSCGTDSRHEDARQNVAPALLLAAIDLRNYPKARCDALSLVKDVLPLFLAENEDFSSSNFLASKPNNHLLALLKAKYYFYW